MIFRVRATYSDFRPHVERRAFSSFICAWWFCKSWTLKHPFSRCVIRWKPAGWWAFAACGVLLFASAAKVLDPVTYPLSLPLSLPSARTVNHAVRAFCLPTSEVIS